MKDRRKIITNVAELLVERFGQNISSHKKIAVAKAVVQLFPILKCNRDDVEPYVSVHKKTCSNLIFSHLIH